MKRILRTVAALGVLGYSALAGAAIINFDVTGTGSVNTVSSFAPGLPNPTPPGTTDFGNYFRAGFSAGSTVQINTDTNGDLTEGDVSITGGTLFVNTVTPIGALGTIVTAVTVGVSGGVGTLSGDQILWDMSGNGGTTYSAVGTFHCTGAGLCGILGLPEGFDLPIAQLGLITGTVPVSPTLLGIWQLDPTHSSILGSTRNTIQLGGATPPPGPGLPAQWYLFGPNDMGHLPEPGAFALVLLGVGGLVLRSRKA